MADLKAKRILGGKYTASDTLEIQLTYTGDAHSCEQYLEIVSGATVTHGGGASADSKIHYKAHLRDDGSSDAVDGVIDYASSQMVVVQSEKGTTVLKVCADLVLKSEITAYNTAYQTWYDAYAVQPESEEGLQVIAGAPSPPVYPAGTTYKSGNVTLEWLDDSFV